MVDELLVAAAEHAVPRRSARSAAATFGHEEELARLRRANEELRRHVQIDEKAIRQLTVDNTQLRSQLEQSVGIADLTARTHEPST